VEEFTVPFAISSKKTLRINSIKVMRDLYNENYSSLKKVITEKIRRWKDIPCS
jgi:hypothetical protein